ncbi:MAG: flagellar basal body P-ring formation chaperone FlgA [Lacipirellulaceae bacterium]
MNRYNLLTVIMALAAVFVVGQIHGAEIRLREQAKVTGSLLLLGDVADIHAATPARRDELATTPLMPAPPQDQRVFLRVAQIRDLLVSRGISMVGINFRGAPQVAIGDRLVATRQAPEVSLSELRQSLEDRIALHLARQTGHADWKIDLVATDSLLRRIQENSSKPTVAGGHEPWIGRQRFEVRQGETKLTIMATVYRMQNAVFLKRNVERGMILRPSDLETKSYQGRLPNNAVTNAKAAIGQEARQTLRAGTLLTSGQVNPPRLVEKGETVTVFARTGGVLVRTLAIAQQNGALGELVRVETLDGDDRYAARVTGHRELQVFATGVNAGELAANTREALLNR